MNLKTAIVLVWIIGAACMTFAAVTDSPVGTRQAADAALLEIERQGFVGSVLVARQGQIEYFGDFGFSGTPDLTPSYWIASITKQFIATGILLLYEQGTLDIHEPISAYLANVPADKDDITLFHLLIHTSGLQQNYAADGITDKTAALEALLKPELMSQPGEEFAYANDNYNILAIILEEVSGKSYEEFLRSEIFARTGMQHAASWGMPIEDGSIVPATATELGPEITRPNWGFRGATGMRASVQDLFSFLQSLEASKLLSEESIELLQGNHVQTSGGTEVGFSWFGRRLDSGFAVRFSSGQESFGGNAVMYIYPEHGLTIITATNAGPAETGDGPVKGWSRVTHEKLAEIFLAN